MTITAAIITNQIITKTGQIDCLLDAMMSAQSILGQIAWEDTTPVSVHGTYTDTDGQSATVSIIDTSSGVLQSAVKDWMAA